MKKNIILFLLLFSFSSYLSGTSVPQNIENDVILRSYRKGFYRQIKEMFEQNPMLTNHIDLQYILASSYLELRDYNKSVEVFRFIDSDKLFFNKKYNHLYPFYVEKYLTALIKLKKKVLSPAEQKTLLHSIIRVPSKTSARKSIDALLFPVLWGEKNYTAMMLFNKNLADEGKAWIELVKFKQNLPYRLEDILKVYSIFKEYDVYPSLLDTIDPLLVTNINELDIYTKMSIPLLEYQEKALVFAQRYAELAQDTEYYVTTQAAILEANSKPVDAAVLMHQYLKANPNLSKRFYQQTHAKLVRRKLFDSADEIAWMAQEQHNLDFYVQLPFSIEYSKNVDRSLDWYKKNYTKIDNNAHNQILRSLIRLNIAQSEQFANIGINQNKNNPNFQLMYALIKEHIDKKEEAYKTYLYLMFHHPFMYEGIVARQKELMLRGQFREIFETYTENIKNSIPNYPLKERLSLKKVMLLDEELCGLIDLSSLSVDQKEFDKIVYKKLKDIPKIPELEKYQKNLSNYSIETMDVLTTFIDKAMKKRKSPIDRARYFYRYRNILLNSEIEGYLTFRLYFYNRDYYSYAHYFSLPKDLLKLTFPKPCFDVIKENSHDDESLAYWMLSSFLTESHFRKRVYSTVGAVGFAQVMPYTADDIKRWMRKPEFTNHDFLDNLRMGVYYHDRIYRQFDNNIYLSLAAYNAGPSAVNRWKKEYSHLTNDIFFFIEAIPYNETRNYVRQITFNYHSYQTLYGERANLLYP
ncbi:MAG: lytic transglycosylase domain-containing protein [Brevinema sp.]